MKEIVIPDCFNPTEVEILCDLVKAIKNRHKEFGEGHVFTFRPLKSIDDSSCRFIMTSDIRPYKLFRAEANTFAETVGKMYIILKEQIP